MTSLPSVTDEAQAVSALDSLARQIYYATAPIAHWGGDLPFDGVLEAIHGRLLAMSGTRAVDQIRTERRRKVFGVRESLAIFRRDGYRCVTCGTDEDLTVDHILAWSKGGSDDHDNLQTLCGPCNSRKGDR